MSASSVTELWSKLASAGLTAGDMPEIEEAHTPWYVRVMLGIAGLIAAGFLLGFVGLGMAFVIKSTTASIAVGLFAIAAAYGFFQTAPRSDFSSMFALAVSFAGQALLIYGIFRLLGNNITSWPFYVVIAAIEVALAFAMPNFIHRVASAYGAGLSIAYACQVGGLSYLPVGIVAAAVAAIWLNEARLGKRHSVVTPIGYGLTLAFMKIQGAALIGHSMAMLFRTRIVTGAWPWVGEALVVGALIVSVWVLLKRAGWAMQSSRALFVMIAVLTIGAVSFKAPGIAGGLMIALLGFSNGNRLLVGLGIAALLVYVSGYYYLLDATLLVKSGVLMATGAVLLAARWLVLNVVMPKEEADA